MDARIEKTLRKIREAYLIEKQNKPIEAVKVSAVCARAGINKTTFYNHYQDVYHLSDSMENELVDGIVSSCKHAAQDMFTFPRALFMELLALSTEKEDMIKLLFYQRYNDFIIKLCDTFLRRNAASIADKRDKRIVSLCLLGSCFLLEKEFTKENISETIELLCEIIEKTR